EAEGEAQRQRFQQLDEQIESLETERAGIVAELRAEWLLQRPVAALEERFDQLSEQLDDRREERRLLRDRPVARQAAGPHDHLRHRRLPLGTDAAIRRRVLTIWAAISTPLVLMAAALLVLPLGPS
ncbi:hypothetical protein V6O07_13735, partial [Arthrospira platensis SPKY2]